jgi:predicted transcriptional regulator
MTMQTVQMTLEPELVARVDRAAKKLKTTRSGFAREALLGALDRLHEEELERKQREGYRQKPVAAGEFGDAQDELAWGDE